MSGTPMYPVQKVAYWVPVTTEMMADCMATWNTPRDPVLGPPAPPAHETHYLAHEYECVVCGADERDRLSEICPFEVVPRSKP
jgi:hypothetical protein